jgi:HAD superfamily hydrolase (TIGR01509 family)
MLVLPVPGHLSLERGPVTGPSRLRLEGVSFDFGNTLVRVDRPGLRSVIQRTAVELVAAGTILDVPSFLAAWAEERDRQFRDDVPNLREVDMAQRVIRVLARLRGHPAPAAENAWDDLAAASLVEAAEVELAIAIYSAAFIATIEALPGSGEILARLAGRGFRLAILSNWPLAATIDRFVEARGWLRYLDAIVVSQRVGSIKPHPDIFRQAAVALDAPPERLLHVGDDWAADVVGARGAGWHVAYVRNRQLDTPLPTSTPDDRVVADMTVDALAEIDPRIERWTP